MSESNTDAVIARGLPQPWEREETFQDVLFDWMQRAPWLAISGVAHVMGFLLLAIIPWGLFEQEEEKVIHATIEQAPEQIVEDLPEEPEPEVEPVETDDEPTLVDSQLPDSDEPVLDEWSEPDEGDPDFNSDSPFEDMAWNAELGIGGGAGGHFGDRGKRGTGSRPGGGGTQPFLAAGIEWLIEHQDQDGKWDCDGFMKHDPAGDQTDGPGQPEHDVGVTGLALLALLGDGNTTKTGQYKEAVARGVQWLRGQQDFESGLFGEKIGHSYMYDHGIASLAMCEAYYYSGSPILRGNVQRATNFITRARNPYGAWRYHSPPNGEDDSSVTGWMVFALKSAEESGLAIDSQAFTDSISWFDEVSDPATGRVGYDSPGSASARIGSVNDQYPTDGVEAMTAVGLLSRFFLGQDPADEPMMGKHADLLLKSLPEWDPDGMSNDMYYWYYGTYAMYQMGGRHWKAWNKAMKRAVIDSQRQDGAAHGSWDPNGPWGFSGGRVYSTASMTLCLEVYFRYSRLLGAR